MLETTTQIGGLIISAVQCALIWWGIRRIDQAGQRREKREDQRHRETMTILQQQGDALRQQGDAWRQQGDALRVLIERIGH